MRSVNTRCVKVIGLIPILTLLLGIVSAGGHQRDLTVRERREDARVSHQSFAATGDTVFYTGFEPGDPLGENVDYNAKASPDMWHVTKKMLYQGTTTWMTAPVDSYFCHIGDDSLGYRDGNEVGYQIQLDLTNYSDAEMFYLSAMQAYANSVFDKFVVWGQYEGMGDNWLNLDPGEGVAWGGDWGTYWYEPEQDVVSLAGLAGHGGVIIEFWFLSDTGSPEGFGVAIDEIVITGTPATAVEGAERSSSLPGSHLLLPPYPNPFNTQVNIRYRLPEPSEIQLNVYNLRGQLVKILASGATSHGEHVVTWDGRDAAGQKVESGIYFCQLKAGGRTQVEKLMLLK